MNGSDSTESKKRFGKKATGGAVVVVFLAIYSAFQPWANERFGWKLPGLRQDSRGNIVSDASTRPNTPSETLVTQAKSGADDEQSSATKSQSPSSKAGPKTESEKPAFKPATQRPKPGQSKTKRGPLASRMRPSKPAETQSARGPPNTSADNSDLRYGLLREVGRERYISPAGLLYVPGSAEGHRLEHLRRHTKDMSGRPVHGVFDGEMEGALKTIDQAYENAKKGVRTTKKIDDGRTVYTVDMGKRVGFSGGRQGSQKRNPMLRRVRLVLDGKIVITAYPVN